MPGVSAASRIVLMHSPSHSWYPAKLRGRSRSTWSFLFTQITQPDTSFNLPCRPLCFSTSSFFFCLRLGSRMPSCMSGRHCRACIKTSRRRIIVFLLPFSLFSTYFHLSCILSPSNRRFSCFSPPPRLKFPDANGVKCRDLRSRSKTSSLDCTRRPHLPKNRTAHGVHLKYKNAQGVSKPQTITRIVKPLRFLSSFSLLPYTFVTRSVHYPVPFVSPLVFIETTRSCLSLFSFPVELLVLPQW